MEYPSKSYKDQTITVTENFHFKVTGELFDDENEPVFETAARAREEIDKREANAVRVRKAEISLPVMDNEGRNRNITGINIRTGILTGWELNKYDEVYPRWDWIRKDLARLRELEAERMPLVDRLGKVAIRAGYAYGRLHGNYDVHIEKLKRSIADKAAIAQAEEERRKEKV